MHHALILLTQLNTCQLPLNSSHFSEHLSPATLSEHLSTQLNSMGNIAEHCLTL